MRSGVIGARERGWLGGDASSASGRCWSDLTLSETHGLPPLGHPEWIETGVLGWDTAPVGKQENRDCDGAWPLAPVRKSDTQSSINFLVRSAAFSPATSGSHMKGHCNPMLVLLATLLTGCVKSTGQVTSVTDVASPATGQNCAWVTAKESKTTTFLRLTLSNESTSVQGQLVYCCDSADGGAPLCNKAAWSEAPGLGAATATHDAVRTSPIAAAAKARAEAALNATQDKATAALAARREGSGVQQADVESHDAASQTDTSAAGFTIGVQSARKFYLQCGNAGMEKAKQRGDLYVMEQTLKNAASCTVTQGAQHESVTPQLWTDVFL